MWTFRFPGAALLAVTAALLAPTAQALAKPPVWIVRDADSEVILFGSVHVLKPGLDWEPQVLRDGLAHADDVWFELPLDPDTEARTGQIAAAKGVLPPDQSLIGMLTPDGRRRLTAACERFHLSSGLIDRLQPWFAEVALAGSEYREAGADAASGVEQTLGAQAPASAERRWFETPEQQIEMFYSAPREAQLASLEESLEELETDPQAYDRLVAAWMASDVDALDRDALEPLRRSSPEVFRKVVTERNAAWTRTLDARLKGKGLTVVVVGVGHLIGPGGAPARLRALGYSVEGP
jgi:uncharacterized protein